MDTSAMTVLDLGAGPRGYVLDWAPMFRKAYASDLRDFSADYGATEIQFVASDGERVDLPDHSIDVIVTHSVLEHVSDLDAVLGDIDRLLRVEGHLFATVSPLYYSPTGLHRKQELHNWEHLDPQHPSYLASTPFYHRPPPTNDTGASLNKLVCSEFLAAVGRQPWEIRSFQRRLLPAEAVPSWVDLERFSLLDVLTREFVFLGRKLASPSGIPRSRSKDTAGGTHEGSETFDEQSAATDEGRGVQATRTERWYPDKIVAGTIDSGRFEKKTMEFLTSVYEPVSDTPFRVAEIGIWKGATSIEIARLLGDDGELHLFDYQDNIESVLNDLRVRGVTNVAGWGCTYKYLDSYNWALKQFMEQRGTDPVFDYVYIDGAHTWAIDALTFLLCDVLLKPGGYVDFDDYGWRLRGSSLDPAKVPLTADLYTEEQIDDFQVKAIVDLLVKPRSDYEEIRPNRIYRKR
jgi:SAM-dependent methyltransferase/predicted O-methyltransferase YrrM